ncbi:type II toxin-antitoxin system PemK/MazF family toxin [Agromyces arachidis]|uniref:type II toxin-antitoxin system PemK/MazF family toxin n=1 Tax=Agromyces arachidis TaxID=766966 RepID=UPI0040563835
MPDARDILTALRRAVRSIAAPGTAPVRFRTDAAPGSRADDLEEWPGRTGPDATVELDPDRVRRVRFAYAPERDGEPDPGEVVWTWVPYEERDGRGKDRPVVIVAAGAPGEFLAVQLTSKGKAADPDLVALGAGAWDGEGRPSWARIDRVFRVHAGGMRREAAALDDRRFALVTEALRARYGWS